MSELDSKRISDYFAQPGTVSEWWTPDSGPLQFHYDAEVQVLRDHVPAAEDSRVLDVGTGRGRFGADFARRGCRVTGVDLNPDMLEIAREAARSRGIEQRFVLEPGSAEDLSRFPDRSFDAVLCMELFDHLPDLARALEEMHRVLRPGGHFAFTYVPNESLYGMLGNVYRWLRARTRPAELMISRTYRQGEIRGLLAAAGFAPADFYGIGILCLNAQTRLFEGSVVSRALQALARAEASRWPYYAKPALARHGAHVVGVARRLESGD